MCLHALTTSHHDQAGGKENDHQRKAVGSICQDPPMRLDMPYVAAVRECCWRDWRELVPYGARWVVIPCCILYNQQRTWARHYSSKKVSNIFFFIASTYILEDSGVTKQDVSHNQMRPGPDTCGSLDVFNAISVGMHKSVRMKAFPINKGYAGNPPQPMAFFRWSRLEQSDHALLSIPIHLIYISEGQPQLSTLGLSSDSPCMKWIWTWRTLEEAPSIPKDYVYIHTVHGRQGWMQLLGQKDGTRSNREFYVYWQALQVQILPEFTKLSNKDEWDIRKESLTKRPMEALGDTPRHYYVHLFCF